jgi:molybdenum cofactor guanylyltransferase/molybdopterin-guanine dinucleotide biosynthesis protein MobB
MKTSSFPSITGVILAGGKARRMGGDDKGLILFNNKPLIRHVIDRLQYQLDTIIINANRNIEHYQKFAYPVISDSLEHFCGPLAGMLSAMQNMTSDYILTAPCDAPMISPHYRQRMVETLLNEQADIAVAHDGQRLQPVFSLISTALQDDLSQFLEQGDRKIDLWFERHKLVIVDFSDQADSFANFNSPEDLDRYQLQVCSPVPLLGFAAFSGTGKTTLLRQLIPVLNKKNINLAVIKHAHHTFDIDTPGKDSYEIRQAGAQQVLVSSKNLMALMEVQSSEMLEPKLNDLIPRINTETIDLILVEGFKDEMFPKIELYRPSLNKPLLYPNDENIIAIASDKPLEIPSSLDQLDLNNIQQIADYIQLFITQRTYNL